jgi:hypothetical protein
MEITMKKFALALLTLAFAPPASAQNNPLVGNWLTTYMDPRGITNYAVASTVRPDGVIISRMMVSGSGGSGQRSLTYSYRMTSPSSYTAQVVDYEPKQMCEVVCLPAPPWIPVGTRTNCQFEIRNEIVLLVSCDGQPPTQFTRQ